MNANGADEAKAARIQKYKEERRRQLAARTAALMSANVTERRPIRKQSEQAASEDPSARLKASSELDLHSASVAIRTTRTSRLRAAAASVDSAGPPKNSLTPPKNAVAPLKNGHSPPKNAAKNNPKNASTASLEEHANCHRKKVVVSNGVMNKRKSIDRIDVKTKRERKKQSERNGSGTGEARAVLQVKRVERFSELLSSMASPGEAEIMFEELVVDDGLLDQDIDLSRLAETPRAEPAAAGAGAPGVASTPRAARTLRDPPPPLRSPLDDAGPRGLSTPSLASAGIAGKTRSRRFLEAPAAKTETSLPSSRVSPKCTSITVKKESPANSSRDSKSPSTSPRCAGAGGRICHRIDSSSKPSFIPLSSKSTKGDRKPSLSPTKPEPSKEAISTFPDYNIKKNSSNENSSARINTNPKVKNVHDLNRLDKAKRSHKNNETSEKYSKKRLTSLDNSKDTFGVRKLSPKGILNDSMQAEDMSTVHGIISHTAAGARSDANLRLSQRMDSLAAFTKQTLDRVNKLSNNDRTQSVASENLKIDPAVSYNALIASSALSNGIIPNYRQTKDKQATADVTERRLKDIDTAAERLRDFEKQTAMYSLYDLKNDASQNRKNDSSLSSSLSHTPVSILKRKSIQEDSSASHLNNHAIATPPVTFSPNVVDPLSSSRLKQGILKKRRSLDESQVSRQRSCSPEVSFADDGSADLNRPILKNRRSSLEDVIRTQSPDGQIQGILKRKMSREEEHLLEDSSLGSPEPQGILKRKSNSSSSSSTTSSHVSIAQAVILAAAGGAEIIEDDKDTVRPILKKKSFSEERPSSEILFSDGPKPILKKKSLTECEDYDYDRPKKTILKSSKKTSSEDGNASSFDLSEDDRSSRRPSLLKSRSDYSGSECETTVKPILKQRCSSLTRERSQSPRPRLSFCDNDSNVTDFSTSASAVLATPLQPRNYNTPLGDAYQDCNSDYPSAVLRRRNQRPRSSNRSKSLACEFNAELLSILNNRRLKVEETCERAALPNFIGKRNDDGSEHVESPKSFPSIAARIKILEKIQTKENGGMAENYPIKSKRDRDRYKTQPITLQEMQSASSSSLEPGQTNFLPFGRVGVVGSFPSRLAGTAAPAANVFGFDLSSEGRPEVSSGRILGALQSDAPTTANLFGIDSSGERRPEVSSGRILDALQSDLARVLVSLDAESRALDERERRAEADAWSLNASCDSGVYNRASSRDSPSGPHSGEELLLTESLDTKGSQASSSTDGLDWTSPTESMERSGGAGGEGPGEVEQENCKFLPGLVKSNSVVARASMWQQLQQQAKGVPRPLIRHSRSKTKELGSAVDSIADAPSTQVTAPAEVAAWADAPQRSDDTESPSKLQASRSLDRDDEAKLDEDDPAKMSLSEKMRMFNSRLNYKPPSAGGRGGGPAAAGRREERCKRLRTMPVLASHVAAAQAQQATRAAEEAAAADERLCKSFTVEDVPRDVDFQRKMALFRSASLRNTSLKYLMEQNEKNKCLGAGGDAGGGAGEGVTRAQRMITPEVRGILKSGATAVPRARPLAKGDSSEGLEDEGINSSSDEESASASSVSSSEKSCSSSGDELSAPPVDRSPPAPTAPPAPHLHPPSPPVLPARQPLPHAGKVALPCLDEMKDRLDRARPARELAKIRAQPSERENAESANRRPLVKKLEGPIQLGKLRRPEREVAPPLPPPPPAPAADPERRTKRTPEEMMAAVQKYIPQVSKSASVAAVNTRLMSERWGGAAGAGVRAARGGGDDDGSGSDGESSGGREVRYINTRRPKHRSGGGGGGVVGAAGGLQRSATHADMPQRGGTTIAERLAALQAAGANDWRSRVCRLSPEQDDTKAIERAKNRINVSTQRTIRCTCSRTNLGNEPHIMYYIVLFWGEH